MLERALAVVSSCIRPSVKRVHCVNLATPQHQQNRAYVFAAGQFFSVCSQMTWQLAAATPLSTTTAATAVDFC